MDKEVKRTPNEWLENEYSGIEIINHAGWKDGSDRNWTDPITESEFLKRLAKCTIQEPIPFN